ncbi:MAG TPA: hypothetical protein VHO94_03720 [Oscillospiraceae bacterium]|nr:hypothetical protein [Oscillospiraceae bacterium]
MENEMTECNCPKTKCERHGNCEECIKHHEAKKRYPPYCKREHKRTKERNRK